MDDLGHAVRLRGEPRLRPRALLIALVVVVGLPLLWLMVRGSWSRKSPPVRHRDFPLRTAPAETPAQAGLRLLGESKPAEALPSLRRAAQLEPNNAIVRNNLAVAEIQTGDLAAAIRDCEQAIALVPDFQLARNNLAWAQAERQKRVKVLEAREKQAPGTRMASAWIAAGMDWYRVAEWDRSLQCFERALTLEPKNVTALNDVGAVWMEKQRPDRAAEMFMRAIAADSSSQLARNNLAWSLGELQKKQPAAVTK